MSFGTADIKCMYKPNIAKCDTKQCWSVGMLESQKTWSEPAYKNHIFKTRKKLHVQRCSLPRLDEFGTHAPPYPSINK